MRFHTAIGQRMRGSWKRAAGAGLTVVMLSIVAIVGLTLFGSEAIAAWKATENAEQILSSGNTLEGLLNFEAPTATMTQLETKKVEAENSIKKASSVPLLVKNWKYTQNQNPVVVYIEGALFQLAVEILDSNPALPPFIKSYLNAELNAWLGLADLYLASLHLPPIPSASPSF